MDTSRPFRLLDLPAELRSKIYEAMIKGNTFGLCELPSLLKLNKQIRKDATLPFYSTAHFEFDLEHLNPTAEAWRKLHPQLREKIASLHYCCVYDRPSGRPAGFSIGAAERQFKTAAVAFQAGLIKIGIKRPGGRVYDIVWTGEPEELLNNWLGSRR